MHEKGLGMVGGCWKWMMVMDLHGPSPIGAFE